MAFNSIEFIVLFLVGFLILYYCVSDRLKNIVLLVFSLFFYAWKQPLYLLMLLGLSLVQYLLLKGGEKKENRTAVMVISVILSLGVLLIFKYANGVIALINQLANLRLKNLISEMPIGVSFYTFQSISFAIDYKRRQVDLDNGLLGYLLGISMFPKLVNGPIADNIALQQQIRTRMVNKENFFQGGNRFVEGLLKKVLLADALGRCAQGILATGTTAALTNWLYVAAYTLQIYFDFSGYSDMAIGLGRMLGFTFDENFDYPYMSASVTEFWRRWHISLSVFFKKYVYFPLGGNRVKPARHVLNILIVWLLTGLWHGATLNFVLWGLFYGVILLVEKYLLKNVLEKIPRFLRRIVTMFLVLMGWCIFSMPDFSGMLSLFANLFNFKHMLDGNFAYYLKNYCLELVFGIALCSPAFKGWLEKEHNIVVEILISLVTLLLLAAVFSKLVADSYSPFLYNNF